MRRDWPEVSIESIASRIAMGPFGSDIKTENYVPSGVPVIRGSNLDGRFRADTFAFVTEEKADQLANANAFPGDLVFTHRGTLGQVGLIPHGLHPRYVVSQSQMKMTCDEKRADPLFVYYYFRSWEGQHALLANTSQTGVPAIARPVTSLKQIRLALPPLAEQRAIGRVLGAIDDKIELNRRTSATLEAMARALFKSWFVDFDPLWAKAEGEPFNSICERLGLTPELLALFSDSHESSSLGVVPAGWRATPLADVTAYLSRGISPKYVDEGGVLVLNQRCIRDGEVDTAKGRRHDAAARSIAGRELRGGDVLVNSTGVGTLGRVAQVITVDEMAVVDSHVTVVRANEQVIPPVYLAMALFERQADIEALAEGSTGQTELSRARLGALGVLIPPPAVLQEFVRRVTPLRAASHASSVQSAALAATRDALLPRLLAGELPLTALDE